MDESGGHGGEALVTGRVQERLQASQRTFGQLRVGIQQQDVVVDRYSAEPRVHPGSETEVGARVHVLGTVRCGHGLDIRITRVVDDPYR